MAVRSPGLSGLAVAVAGAGALLLYTGLRNIGTVDALRSVVGQGSLPAAGGSTVGSLASITTPLDNLTAAEAVGAAVGDVGTIPGELGAGGGVGGNAATAARKYLGARYVFGAAGPTTFDCSGLVTWVLHHDLGVDLSAWHTLLGARCSNGHTTAIQFLYADGLQTIPRTECAAGDLVCWTGHIGIAVSESRFIAATHPGSTVKEETIWSHPSPTIRRMRG